MIIKWEIKSSMKRWQNSGKTLSSNPTKSLMKNDLNLIELFHTLFLKILLLLDKLLYKII